MKTISFINMKGGVAKTTLATNVADCLVRRNDKIVLFIDVDPQFNATQCLMSPASYIDHLKKGGHTILQVFDRAVRPSAASVTGASNFIPTPLENIVPYEINPGFYLLPGNLELYRLEMAPGEGREQRLKRYLDHVSAGGKFDFVIIDTPPTPSAWMTSALIASQFYVIPVKPDPLSFTGIDLLASVISDRKENFDLKISCLGVVLTIAEENTVVYGSARTKLEGDKNWKPYLYARPLPKRTEVARLQQTQSMILASGDDYLKSCLVGITSEMLDRLTPRTEAA